MLTVWHADWLLEIAGVFFSALSGGLSAARTKFDLFGVLVLAWLSGLGGGILRDVLIGAVPPVGISEPDLVATAVLGGLVIFFFHRRLHRMRRAIIVLDAVALGLFVVVGTTKGIAYDVGPLAAVIVGTITGIGGGVLRDLLSGQVPLVLQDKQLYAVPALVGAVAVVVLDRAGALNPATSLAVAIGIVAFRLLSLRRGWTVPDTTTTLWRSPIVRGMRDDRTERRAASLRSIARVRSRRGRSARTPTDEER